MRSSKSLAFIAYTLLGTIAAVAGCSEDPESPGATGSGGSSSGTSGTGGSKGGTSGTSSGTGGSTGGAGTGGAPTGGRAGSSSGGSAGTNDAGDGGMGTGGDVPGGAGGEGGGSGGSDRCGIAVSDVEHALLERLGPLPAVPADTTNQYADNAAARALGQRFFFDKAFSGKLTIASDLGAVDEVGKVACSSCHLGEMMEDQRSNPPQVSIAAGRHARNAPGVVNSAFYVWTNWAGRFSAQWELPLPVVENGVIMNGNRLAVAHRIASRYRAEYEAVFGALDAELGTTSTRFPPSGKPKPVTDPPTADGPWELMAPADRDI
ncbi:MAG TPA: cytochrome-c peroxidase, partial [Polyangiaceae bacterium]